MNNLLFLCTGNYYRSRFCEAWFNHLAQQRGLRWQADSCGLAPDVTVFGNLGPLSPYTQQALRQLGVRLPASLRHPRPAQPADFAQAQHIIALSRDEHAPMVAQHFSAYAAAVEYWQVSDLPLTTPAPAVAAMQEAVKALVDRLDATPGAGS
jgi:protein-tyrosine phosphatase